jgi:hypothetical protein
VTQAIRTMIPVEESFAAWRKDPEYVKAYNDTSKAILRDHMTALNVGEKFREADEE